MSKKRRYRFGMDWLSRQTLKDFELYWVTADEITLIHRFAGVKFVIVRGIKGKE